MPKKALVLFSIVCLCGPAALAYGVYSFHADNLFKFLHLYSDADLTAAFVHYNKLRRKVDLGTVVLALPKRPSIIKSMLTLFRK